MIITGRQVVAALVCALFAVTGSAQLVVDTMRAIVVMVDVDGLFL